jgi:hypothetical protein
MPRRRSTCSSGARASRRAPSTITFPDKQAIFRAVFEAVEDDLVAAALAGSKGADALTRSGPGAMRSSRRASTPPPSGS